MVGSVSVDLNAAMDAIGTAMADIDGLRVFDFLPDSATPPFAFVDFPDEITYDNTMARGTDQATMPVFVAVGRVSDRARRDELSAYLAGTGDRSIKAAVDLPGVRRVARSSVQFLDLAGQTYLAARFDVVVTQ